MDEKKNEVLPQCDVKFEQINTIMSQIGTDVKKITEMSIRVQESTRGIWHEIRDDIKPQITRLHERMDAKVDVKSSSPFDVSKLPKWTYFFIGFGITLGTAAIIAYKFGVFG